MPSLLDYIFCCLSCERPPKKYDNSERTNIGVRSIENDYLEKENDYLEKENDYLEKENDYEPT